MKQNWINLFCGILFLLSTSLFGQIAEQYNFLSEMQRRDIFRLDDWVGYGNLRHITWISEDARRVYFATWGSGVWRYNKETGEWEYPFTTCNGLPENYVSWVYYDDSQDLLFVQTNSDEGVFNFTRNRWEIKSQMGYWPYKPNFQPANPGDSVIKSGAFYPRENLNLLNGFQSENADYTVINQWKVQDRNFNEYEITGFFIDSYDNIFFPVENLGIALGKRYSGMMKVLELGIGEISPRELFFNSDAIWIGGQPKNEFFSGITRWKNDNSFSLFTARYLFGLYSDNVYDITGFDSILAVATDLGLSLFDERANTWTTYDGRDGLPDANLRKILIEDSIIWVGGTEGLGRFNLNKKKGETWQRNFFYNQSVNDFCYNDSLMVMATRIGVFIKTWGDTLWHPFEIKYLKSKLYINSVDMNDSLLWIAGEGGLVKFNLHLKKWQFFPGISNDYAALIRDLQIYPGGVAASTNMGLLIYEKNREQWRLYTQNDGLLNNSVYNIYYENGILWMATSGGICQFKLSRHHLP